ncbi:MAG: tetratricopeptide repeat protein, partial [Chloroflexi bacterium]|nr:tetratricopeptide repeat protein [Chloroflexota bacterium]
MVGEAFVLLVLGRLSEQAGQEAVARAERRAGEWVVASVIRAAQDYAYDFSEDGSPGRHQRPLGWLERLIEDSKDVLDSLLAIDSQLLLKTGPQLLGSDSERLGSSGGYYTTVLRAQAARVSQGIVTLLRSSSQPTRTPLLAGHLNNLAIRLSELGRREEALAPAQEAVELYRELGRREEALAPAQE